MHRLLALFLLFAGLIVPAFAAAPYRIVPVPNAGTIKGRVTLASAAEKPARLPVSQDDRVCGVAKQCPGLAVGKNGGVANTLIYLEDIREGKDFPTSSSYLLNQQKCQYAPHVSIVPVGSRMEIMNSDPILHNVHAYGGDGKMVFNIAQPMKGIRTKTRVFDTPGILKATCDAGHPWMLAYIAVAPHPYYVVTDADGNFSLDGVPPGTYVLKLWHEGARITGTDALNGKVRFYKYEDPYELSSQVVVTAGATTSADFTFHLREGAQ